MADKVFGLNKTYTYSGDQDYYYNLTNSHFFHLVEYSPWPLLVGLNMFFLATFFIFWMNRVSGSYFFVVLLFVCLMFSLYGWFRDMIMESSYSGQHTSVVSRGLTLGFLLFLGSEVMFFFGFFWGFFHVSLSPSMWVIEWPPFYYPVMDAKSVPLVNTLLLILSGAFITWSHKSLCSNGFKTVASKTQNMLVSLGLTIFLGLIFMYLQVQEYISAPFEFADMVYGSTFYSLTGLHGFHVTMGIMFLFVNLLSYSYHTFSGKKHLGFKFAIWYWHFVDIVWVILYACVYGWGNWVAY